MDPYERVTQVDKRIAEEVKKRENLYNPSSKFYKDATVTYSSWKEIADQMGLEYRECLKSWRVLRDRYVRVKKAWDSKGGRGKKPPSIYTFLSWLEPHIKHRKPSADAETETSETAHETQVEITAETTLVPPHREEELGMDSTETSETAHETQVEITAETTLVPPHGEEDRPPPSSAFASRQRRRIEEMESRLQSHVDKLEERRAQLEQQKMALAAQKMADDEVDKFSLMVASLLRKVPEELRPEAMFEVHKIMYEKLLKAKQTAAEQVS